jgi:LCP family protein required for cell wall assembly
MSDGRGWYPGDSDPEYEDPYTPPQSPSGYGPPAGPRPGGRGPGYGPNRGQGGQRGQGYEQDPGYGRGRPGQGQGPGYGAPGQPPGRGGYDRPGGYDQPPGAVPPRPPRDQDPDRYGDGGGRRGAQPPAPAGEDATRADVWQAPGDDGPQDAAPELVEAGRPRRRRSGAAAGTGPGRQTTASTGPSHLNEDVDLDEIDPQGRAQRAWAKQQAALNRPKSRAKQATKWTAIGMCLILLAAGGFVVYIYETTVGDIKHTALTPPGMTQAALPPDPYGNTAQNILLIGSDTRDTTSDCSLGGSCSDTNQADNVGANADSEMILHIAAEGNNATMLSIPRDTVADLPNCTESNGVTTLTGSSSDYQINSALQYGPACQVAAVHALTNITITGYIMFDFSGIVTMSQALGGVPVCVTAPVNDKNSGLKLPAGTSVIQGDQALEFLRTRDSFFDGSDLGREQATHYFLSQMIQTLRKSVDFTNIGELISIGQAAAKSTTVSDNYAGLSNLEGLVESMNKVPTNSIALLTMPWEYDPNNNSRVIPSSAAASVFAAIQGDTSFSSNTSKPTAKTSTSAAPKTSASSAPPAAPSTSASTSASVDDAQVPVNVYNADGVNGRATTIKSALISAGFNNTVSQGNAQTVSTSQVTYDSNQVSQADADAVAKALAIPTSQVKETTSFQGVSVFIGKDFESGTTLPSIGSAVATPSVNTSGAASAPADSHETFASGSENECIPVESGNLTMASKS